MGLTENICAILNPCLDQSLPFCLLPKELRKPLGVLLGSGRRFKNWIVCKEWGLNEAIWLGHTLCFHSRLINELTFCQEKRKFKCAVNSF